MIMRMKMMKQNEDEAGRRRNIMSTRMQEEEVVEGKEEEKGGGEGRGEERHQNVMAMKFQTLHLALPQIDIWHGQAARLVQYPGQGLHLAQRHRGALICLRNAVASDEAFRATHSWGTLGGREVSHMTPLRVLFGRLAEALWKTSALWRLSDRSSAIVEGEGFRDSKRNSAA